MWGAAPGFSRGLPITGKSSAKRVLFIIAVLDLVERADEAASELIRQCYTLSMEYIYIYIYTLRLTVYKAV